MRFSTTVTALLLTLALAAALPATEIPAEELEAKVPALFALHEVVYPLWHEAWPAKDAARMIELLPAARAGADAVRAAELPGILRDKQAAWQSGIAQLDQAMAAYEAAAKAEDQAGLIGAVEQFHSAFEGLIRVVRPPMPQLEAYHQVLYGLYHYELPAEDLAAVRATASRLQDACGVLAEAEAPSRWSDRAAELRRRLDALCTSTELLASAAAGEEWPPVAAAAERVHDDYQSAASLLEH